MWKTLFTWFDLKTSYLINRVHHFIDFANQWLLFLSTWQVLLMAKICTFSEKWSHIITTIISLQNIQILWIYTILSAGWCGAVINWGVVQLDTPWYKVNQKRKRRKQVVLGRTRLICLDTVWYGAIWASSLNAGMHWPYCAGSWPVCDGKDEITNPCFLAI